MTTYNPTDQDILSALPSQASAPIGGDFKDEDILSALPNYQAVDQDVPQKPLYATPTLSEAASNIKSGLVRGIYGVAALPENIAGLADRSAEYLKNKITGDDKPLGPGYATKAVKFIEGNAPTQEQMEQSYQDANGPLYQPQSYAGGLGQAAVSTIPSVLAGGPVAGEASIANTAKNIGSGMVAGAGAQTASDIAPNNPLAPVIGAALGGTGALVAGKSGNAALNIAAPELTADANAVSRLGRAIGRDEDAKIGIPEMQQALQDANGKPLAIADVGGPGVKNLAGTVARTPAGATTAASFLDSRDAASGSRIMGDVGDLITKNSNAYQTIDDLQKAQKQASAPLYETAMAQPSIEVSNLSDFLGRPAFQSALKNAVTIAKNDPNFEGPPIDNFITQNAQGNMITSKAIPMPIIDYIKKGLDDVVQAAKNPLTGKIEGEGPRAINNLRGQFLETVDKINPAYAEARAAYSGPAQSMDAVQKGQNFLNQTPEKTAKDIDNLSDGDKQFYLTGAADAIRQKVLSSGNSADEAKRVIGNELLQQRLKPLFSSTADYNQFIGNLKNESKMFDTKTAVSGNSATAARLAADQAENGNHGSGFGVPVGLLLGGDQHGAAFAAGGQLLSKLRGQGMNSATARALSNMLYNSDPAQNAAILNKIIPGSPPGTLALAGRALNNQIVPRLIVNESPNNQPQ